jgi:protein involved in polysaccharide export with SLBB domain
MTRCSSVFAFLLAMIAMSGCASIVTPPLDPSTLPHIPESIPRELHKASLPDYIIEPPDVISIDAVKTLVPKPPYKLEPLDVIEINVTGAPEEAPIAGIFTLEFDGTVELGVDYGSIKLGGLTTEEAEKALTTFLKPKLTEVEDVMVALRQSAGTQQIAGPHLVQPDGKVNLSQYGRVRVVGMTIEEAAKAVETHLAKDFVEPKIAVDVTGFNSKVYYIVTQGAGLGDSITAVSSQGNETVLDAISAIGGLNSQSSYKIWVARPGGNEHGGDQLLPVDLLAITQLAATRSNFQLLPGDRVYIAEDPLIAFDNRIGKIFAPIERILGFTLLASGVDEQLNRTSNTGLRLVP